MMDPGTISAVLGTSGGPQLQGIVNQFSDTEPSEPDLFTPMNLVGLWMTYWAGEASKAESDKALESTLARYAQGYDILVDALEGGMATYDAEAQKALDELLGAQGVSREMREELTTGIGTMLQEREDAYSTSMGSFMDDFRGQAGDITQGYADRYSTAEADIAGYGEQMSEDIDRYFADQGGQVMQGLIDRGMTGSLSGAGEMLGVTERQSAEQRRLGEDLTRMRLGHLSNLSGEGLLAQERMFGAGSSFENAQIAYEAALAGDSATMMAALGQWNVGEEAARSGDIAGLYQTTARDRSNMFTQGMGNLANWTGSMTAVPQPINPAYYYNFGAAAAPTVQYPGAGSSFMQGAGQGMAQTATQGLNSLFNPPAASPQVSSAQSWPEFANWIDTVYPV